ncbi:DUF3307 domain-containing protein [Propionispira raffinosivorans]|uniref:DUF3307 domain-containing protein n=1 Tax=Propionispira raffinosivorans TaxID=86959 RepID=UPI000382763D|nr:DUF3307 domain-containing protein [Propionispira raffinosivorans]
MDNGLLLLIKLITGHLLGDFVFQTNGIAKKKKTSLSYLFIHIMVIFVSLLICTVEYWDFRFISCIGLMALTHLIDRVKQGTGLTGFLLDQIFHIALMIFLLVSFGYIHYLFYQSILVESYQNFTIWIYILGYLFAVVFARYFIQLLFVALNLIPIPKKFVNVKNEGKSPLSAYIGMSERTLILTLALINQYTAIGFVFMIKGIARKTFVEQCNENGEFFFLGTSISFLIAILTALAIQKVVP